MCRFLSSKARGPADSGSDERLDEGLDRAVFREDTMLFKVDNERLKPVGFEDYRRFGGREKDLENLMAKHLFDDLFENNPYLVITQERPFREEPDILAVDRNGDLVLFELKLSSVDDSAVHQAFRYVERFGTYTYKQLNRLCSGDLEQPNTLQEIHQENFLLSEPLRQEEFNRHQKMVVVGNSADESLVRSVEFWRGQGIDIDFIPYRIYRLHENLYLEFFAKPYDQHTNPIYHKGVMFDTNRSYDEEALQYMLDKGRVAAWDSRAAAVTVFSEGDYVFLSHKGVGLVAAGRVHGGVHETNYGASMELYRNVRFETPVPDRVDGCIPRLTFGEVAEIVGRGFYWARIDKRPYLTAEESELLLQAMQERFGKG